MTTVEVLKINANQFAWNGAEIDCCILAKYFSAKVFSEDIVKKLDLLVENKIITKKQKEQFHDAITHVDLQEGTKKDVRQIKRFSKILRMDFKIIKNKKIPIDYSKPLMVTMP